MEKYMSDQYADFQKDMLTDRNKRWVESFEEMEGEKSSFIAIGAGHLPGKEGLIELLREEGYTVEAVK
jgi:uncharacterized protein YbaP (TraB family)